jgi:hypothetical protein
MGEEMERGLEMEQLVSIDELGQPWENLLLSAGEVEIGRLPAVMAMLRREGWLLDPSFDYGPARDEGALLLWLRRPLDSALPRAKAA